MAKKKLTPAKKRLMAKRVKKTAEYMIDKMEHDLENLQTLRESFGRFLDEEAEEGVDKSQPTSSQVHVPGIMGAQEARDIHAQDEKREEMERERGILKDDLTTEGRKNIASHNFAMPAERKYPIADISHARNALARSSGKPEEAKVRAAVYRKYPSLKKSASVDLPKDTSGDELEELIKASLGGMGDNSASDINDMSQIVAGCDYELENTTTDMELAREIALDNLSKDPDYYRKKDAYRDWTSDPLAKDTGESEQDAFDGEGYNLDLGSGAQRQPGHVGIDLYPHDYATHVHDLTMGIPVPDESCRKVRLVNALHTMDDTDQKPLLSEIQRVLMPGGQFYYEGPNEIYNYQKWQDDFPGLELTNHEDSDATEEGVHKIEGSPAIYRRTFTRLATPDPATANDAEPRIGISQYDDLPADALLAMDALGYYWSDSTSSGRGNRLHGYPSQGAMIGEASTNSIKKILKSGGVVPIVKQIPMKQIVYGVVTAPDEVDAQEDFMEPEEIEKAAHLYLVKSRIVGESHTNPMAAEIVESYIAPCDFDVHGQYGLQTVKKGSWVLAAKINDPEQWQKVLDGEYTGFSVGGLGLRD